MGCCGSAEEKEATPALMKEPSDAGISVSGPPGMAGQQPKMSGGGGSVGGGSIGGGSARGGSLGGRSVKPLTPGIGEMVEGEEFYLGEDQHGDPVHGVLVVTEDGHNFITQVKTGQGQGLPRVHRPMVDIPEPKKGLFDEIRENLIVTDSRRSSHGELAFP